MFYHVGFVLLLATAASGRKWFPLPRPTSNPQTEVPIVFEHSTVMPLPIYSDEGSKAAGERVIIGYEPVYGELEGKNDIEIPSLSQDWSFKCPRRFGYYRYPQSCDIYIECRYYEATRKVCPDGMHFKDSPNWSEYPCAYPPEALCPIRSGALPARPTAECPHQFGNFPITDELRYAKHDRCNSYISCSSGVAHVMNCTFGLVFNPKINLCDWPEQVPGCHDIFDFRCPVPHIGEEDMVINYRYPGDPDCRYFYSCLNGGYRLLACDEGLYFNYKTGRCVEENEFTCNVATQYPYFVDERRSAE